MDKLVEKLWLTIFGPHVLRLNYIALLVLCVKKHMHYNTHRHVKINQPFNNVTGKVTLAFSKRTTIFFLSQCLQP